MTDYVFEDDPDYDPPLQVNERGAGLHISRGYDPDRDGWMQHQIRPGEYPVIKMAAQICDMADEINFLRRKLWDAERRLRKEDEHRDKMLGLRS